MLTAKVNPATGDREAQKETTSWWDGAENNRHARTSKAIRAALRGDNICDACGIAVRSSAPLLALCRALVEAGHVPAIPLEAQINAYGTGFRPRREADAAPPMNRWVAP